MPKSKKPRKAYRPRVIDRFTPLRALTLSQNGVEDNTERHLKLRLALEAMLGWEAGTADYDALVMAMQTGNARAVEIGDARLLAPMRSALLALREIRQHYEQTGAFQPRTEHRMALMEALDVYEAIANASSPMQMEVARQAINRGLQLARREALRQEIRTQEAA